MAQENQQFQKAWAKIVAKAWSDPTFKQKLLQNPAQVCKENGCELPQGKTFKIVENTEQVSYFVLPLKPSGALSEETLQKFAGGGCAETCTHTGVR